MPNLDEALEAAISQAVGGTGDATPTPTEAPAPAATEAPPTPSEAPARVRDGAGRFATKTPVTPPPEETAAHEQPAATPTPTAGQQPQKVAQPGQQAAPPPGGSAPRTWAPAVREHWNAVPREVKDQILKREGEVTRVLNESAQARKLAEGFEKVLTPYRAHIQGEPLAVVDNLMRTAVQLQTAPPQHKAALVAQIIKAYGVPVDALDEALQATLGGQQPQHGAQQPAQYRDPRLDTLLAEAQRAKAVRQQDEAQRVHQEVEAFAPSAEFLEDVREDMADMMEAAARKGRPLTLQDAYDRACFANPEVRGILAQRKAQEATRTQSQQAQQARYAAGSVQSEPAPPAGSRKPTMEQALWAAVNGR